MAVPRGTSLLTLSLVIGSLAMAHAGRGLLDDKKKESDKCYPDKSQKECPKGDVKDCFYTEMKYDYARVSKKPCLDKKSEVVISFTDKKGYPKCSDGKSNFDAKCESDVKLYIVDGKYCNKDGKKIEKDNCIGKEYGYDSCSVCDYNKFKVNCEDKKDPKEDNPKYDDDKENDKKKDDGHNKGKYDKDKKKDEDHDKNIYDDEKKKEEEKKRKDEYKKKEDYKKKEMKKKDDDHKKDDKEKKYKYEDKYDDDRMKKEKEDKEEKKRRQEEQKKMKKYEKEKKKQENDYQKEKEKREHNYQKEKKKMEEEKKRKNEEKDHENKNKGGKY